MEQSGEYPIAAPREAVWAALNDPDTLRACIAGCQALTQTGEHAFAAEVKAKVGPVSATFKGAVTLVDLNPPESYRLLIEAQGGAAGFGKGEAAVALEETPEGSLLRYTATATVGGKLAQIGSRLIDAAVRQMAANFFAAFSERVAGMGDAAAPAAASSDASTPAAAALGRSGKLAAAAGIALLIWAIVAIFGGGE